MLNNNNKSMKKLERNLQASAIFISMKLIENKFIGVKNFKTEWRSIRFWVKPRIFWISCKSSCTWSLFSEVYSIELIRCYCQRVAYVNCPGSSVDRAFARYAKGPGFNSFYTFHEIFFLQLGNFQLVWHRHMILLVDGSEKLKKTHY